MASNTHLTVFSPFTSLHLNRSCLLFFTCMAFLCSCSEKDHPLPDKEDEDDDEIIDSRLEWWKNAQFGMFIHFGMYSALAGEYIGENVAGNPIHFQSYGNKNTNAPDITRGIGIGAEWIMSEASIPRENYRAFAPLFTADKYDPQAIVELARKAGMKYIVLTAKHHDGFCLWQSKVTDWNLAQTPAGKRWKNDLITPLAKAARDAGLKFGIYFSHARDWMHPGALGPIPELSQEEYSYTENQQYMDQYTYPMISELLSRYHPDIFWWDSPECNPYEEFSKRCHDLINNFDSSILQNNRLSTLPGYQGDFDTPEQSIDESKAVDKMELCMTMNSSWGYNRFDETWKRPEFILWCLLRAGKLGGNLLLNIGPRGDGSIPEASQQILATVGKWIDKNSNGVYNTRKSPFQYNMPYGPTTWNNTDNKRHLYYHIFHWNGSGELWIPGVMNSADEVELSFTAVPHLNFRVEAVENIGLHITGLPIQPISELCTTLDIKFLKKIKIEEGFKEINKEIDLNALAAQISGVDLENWDSEPNISWFAGKKLSYKIDINQEGTYNISAFLAGFYPGTITFDFGNGISTTGSNTTTPGGHNHFEWQDMGTIRLMPSTYTLNITSTQPDNSWLKVREFKLKRQN